jgi:tryptophanyl-tRNA synthetase
MQALTDHADRTGRVRDAVLEIALDYLAVGVDPERTVICLQSGLPALAELSMLYLNLATVSRLERIPTIREEIASRGFGRAVPAGFLCYPVAQAADITGFRAELVPVGADQAPLIELSNELVRRVNGLAGRVVLPEARALIPEAGRLPAANGQGKMSKSAPGALPLSAGPDQITSFVRSMFTDPDHLRVQDPGRVEGNVVFTYLDAFDPDRVEVDRLKGAYERGGLGDGEIKRRLEGVLQELIRPIRDRRAALATDPGYVLGLVRDGTRRARDRTGQTHDAVFEALGVGPL